MIHTTKKRVHFRISCEALQRLDELVNVANKATAGSGCMTRSDIIEQVIIKNTRNKREVIDEQIKEHAIEINKLQQLRRDLEDQAHQQKIIDIEKEK